MLGVKPASKANIASESDPAGKLYVLLSAIIKYNQPKYSYFEAWRDEDV